MVVMLSAFAAISIGGLLAVGLNAIRLSADERGEWVYRHANRGAKNLAAYLISNNLILCREGGWTGFGANQRCRWGGHKHTPELFPKDFNLSNQRYGANGELVFDYAFESGGVSTKTDLKFQLVDWDKSEELRHLLGEIPVEHSIVDDDWTFVHFRASTARPFQSPYFRQGAMRRPVGWPVVSANSLVGLCSLQCAAATSQNPSPICAGPQVAPPGLTITFHFTIRNLGPGPIYQLTFEREFQPYKNYFAKKTFAPVEVDFMGGEEVIMPGEEFTVTDGGVPCPRVSGLVISPADQASDPTVNCAGCGGGGGLTLRTRGAHLIEVAKVNYRLSVTRYTPESYFETDFLDSYNPHDPSTFTPNPSLSRVEPRKLLYDLDNYVEPGSKGLGLNMRYIPPH